MRKRFGISIFVFVNKTLLWLIVDRTLWIEACHRTDDVNADNSLICSNHFLPEDFKRDLKNELLNLPLIKRLNEGVIPTQRLTLQQNTKLSEDV